MKKFLVKYKIVNCTFSNVIKTSDDRIDIAEIKEQLVNKILTERLKIELYNSNEGVMIMKIKEIINKEIELVCICEWNEKPKT